MLVDWIFLIKQGDKMKVAFKTAHGYLSFQPDGSVQYRDNRGPWEEFDIEGFELSLPSPIISPGIDPIIETCGNLEGEELVRCVYNALQPRSNPDLVLKMAGYVAWILRHQGAGLLRKQGGANIGDYHGTMVSIGRILFRDGTLIKIMTDVPNGEASWQDNGTELLSNWVAPVQP
jgi:hypothetical protein